VLACLCACGGGSDGAAASGPPADGAEAVVERLRLAGSALEEPLPRPDFVLTDTQGEPFAFRERTAGRLTLLFFGYTSCPDICPVHLANIDAALERLPYALSSRVEVVFVGVDAERDDRRALRSFLDRFDRDFVGLTGSADELAAAQRAAGVPPAYIDAKWEDGYSVSHAGWITVFTPDDLAHLRYPFGVRQSEWVHDLAVLAEQGWPDA